MENWAELDEHRCACQGLGWAETGRDKYVECPVHYEGQLHPDTQALLLDEPARMAAEERKARLHYQIREARTKVTSFQGQIKIEQTKLAQLELELINRTPTVRAMQAVVPAVLELEINDDDFILEGEAT